MSTSKIHSSHPERPMIKQACQQAMNHIQYYYIKKVFPDAINRYKDIFDNGMELDIYIPSLKLGIEYDGEAWHKEKNKDRERRKYEICQKNGIKLKRLREKPVKAIDMNADSALSIEGRMYEPDKLEQLIRVLLDDLDPKSNKWTRKDPFHFHSDVDINIKRDELEIRKYMTNVKGKSFADAFPDLAKEWHPTKNGEVTPQKVKPHSGFSAYWICSKCGNEYKMTVNARSYGSGCKICAIQKNNLRKSRAVKMIDKDTGETIKMFESISEACRQLGCSSGNISSVCRGQRKYAYGYIWKYLDEEK